MLQLTRVNTVHLAIPIELRKTWLQNPWEQLPDIPHSVDWATATCQVLDDHLWVLVSHNSEALVLPLNDPSTATWSSKYMGWEVGKFPSSTVVDGRLQVLTYRQTNDVVQVKAPAPSNDWLTIRLASAPLGGFFATKGLISGAIDGGKVHMACGGYNLESNEVMQQCFALHVAGTEDRDDPDGGDESEAESTITTSVYTQVGDIQPLNHVEPDVLPPGTMTVSQAASLPHKLENACYGSDGDRMVVAGGWQDDPMGDGYRRGVLVLGASDQQWQMATAKLSGFKSLQAGLLVGDDLLCFGGRQHKDGNWQQDQTLASVEVVNLPTGTVTEQPLPGDGFGGCAAVHDGFVYWVRGHTQNNEESNEVYRARVTSILGPGASTIATAPPQVTPSTIPNTFPFGTVPMERLSPILPSSFLSGSSQSDSKNDSTAKWEKPAPELPLARTSYGVQQEGDGVDQGEIEEAGDEFVNEQEITGGGHVRRLYSSATAAMVVTVAFVLGMLVRRYTQGRHESKSQLSGGTELELQKPLNQLSGSGIYASHGEELF